MQKSLNKIRIYLIWLSVLKKIENSKNLYAFKI